jgi:hypothetical protein
MFPLFESTRETYANSGQLSLFLLLFLLLLLLFPSLTDRFFFFVCLFCPVLSY